MSPCPFFLRQIAYGKSAVIKNTSRVACTLLFLFGSQMLDQRG